MGSRASDTLGRMSDRPPIELLLGDVIRLRRVHPCGGDEWLVDRLGADIGLRCRRCGRHVLVERRTIERRLAGFVSRGDRAMSAAVAPAARDPLPASAEATDTSDPAAVDAP
jgi:hypothetical protein